MGYTIKQKIEICLKADSNPNMTQSDLANWAMKEFGSEKPPSQTTISRILSSKNDIIASKDSDFQLVRRRKQANPMLRKILTEWITQAIWENIPITTPIIQSTANAIWTRLPKNETDGNGVFNQKWGSHFIKKLNINITGNDEDIRNNWGFKLNKVWKLDEKIELKQYLNSLIVQEGYLPQDIFVIDEFQLFYSLPLDQIFDVSSIDVGLQQSSQNTEYSLTILLGCNIDGSEKLSPLIVGKYDKFDISKSSNSIFQNLSNDLSQQQLMNKLTEAYNIIYKSNINKWITSSIFQNYLITLDHKLKNSSRKLLILLDDSSSHRIINLKFNNLKLIYFKNETNHKNPYNTNYSGVKFDYLPMNFGIIEEFKILYRLQQYLEMINLQRNNSRKSKIDSNNFEFKVHDVSPSLEVLSETDYHIPMIKVIEWITRAWHSLTQERIFHSWKRTNLFNLKIWENNDSIIKLNGSLQSFDEMKSYRKLKEVMSYLNVVIPWEIDELIGLVNERGKVTLNYASIEEIIGSCLSELNETDELDNENDFDEEHEDDHDHDVDQGDEQQQWINELNSINSLNNKHKLSSNDQWNNNKKKIHLSPTLSTLSTATPINNVFDYSLNLQNQYPTPNQTTATTLNSNTTNQFQYFNDQDMIKVLSRVLEYSSNNILKLSQSTIDDLTYNLRIVQQRNRQ
ncbi:unnamed protein product [Candida verbasci]|uniref:HTH CENPB-type domain-containing protein n=1 Tax=Candida verbasci TaxID=1227364 RepID=A0A9W4TUP9_9ASCO|nr:unnamed protein product [Candida verbasci]